MLDELSKNNEQWLKIAYQLCKDKDTAKDLVQDMYLKLYQLEKEISVGYIYFTIKSIWLNQIKKNKEIPTEEIISQEQSEYDFYNDAQTQIKIDLINEKIQNSDIVQKTIVKHSFEKGLREFNRKSKIPILTIQRYRAKFKDEIWKEAEKKLKDLEM